MISHSQLFSPNFTRGLDEKHVAGVTWRNIREEANRAAHLVKMKMVSLLCFCICITEPTESTRNSFLHFQICGLCRKAGANIGCEQCKGSYHVTCGMQRGAVFLMKLKQSFSLCWDCGDGEAAIEFAKQDKGAVGVGGLPMRNEEMEEEEHVHAVFEDVTLPDLNEMPADQLDEIGAIGGIEYNNQQIAMSMRADADELHDPLCDCCYNTKSSADDSVGDVIDDIIIYMNELLSFDGSESAAAADAELVGGGVAVDEYDMIGIGHGESNKAGAGTSGLGSGTETINVGNIILEEGLIVKLETDFVLGNEEVNMNSLLDIDRASTADQQHSESDWGTEFLEPIKDESVDQEQDNSDQEAVQEILPEIIILSDSGEEDE